MPAFQGFGAATVRFLQELEANNNRDWFQANKHRYEAEVLAPALDFISAMSDELDGFAPHFTALPKRMGGSLMRVYRDVRFSPSKAPYKTNIGIQFRHEQGKDVHAPGYYLHIESTGCFFGAGMWRPVPEALQAIRSRIAEQPQAWRRVLEAREFTETFRLGGDALKRPPRGYAADLPHIEDLKRKSFIGSCDFPVANAASPGFPQEAAATFAKAAPLMAFLCAALNVPF